MNGGSDKRGASDHHHGAGRDHGAADAGRPVCGRWRRGRGPGHGPVHGPVQGSVMMAEVARRGPGHRGAASGGVCVAPKYVGFENRGKRKNAMRTKS